MNTELETTPIRQAAVNGLAVVGFVALVAAGVWLAVYSTRFVPTVANRIGAAAVYLGSVVAPGTNPTLSVVPAPATTTPPFDIATTSPATGKATTTSPTPAAPSKPLRPIAAPLPPAPYGLPDLTVQIVAVGYVTCDSPDCFVASASVPAGYKPAVKFTVKNNGTNVTGVWNLDVSVPGQDQKFDDLESMPPSEQVTYVTWVTNTRGGSPQTATITVNYDGSIAESNTANNTVSAPITFL